MAAIWHTIRSLIAEEQSVMPGLPVDYQSLQSPKNRGFGAIASVGLFILQLVWLIPGSLLAWGIIGDHGSAFERWLIADVPSVAGFIFGMIAQTTIRARGERYTGLLGIILNITWIAITAWAFHAR
jgi:hypothetical protein